MASEEVVEVAVRGYVFTGSRRFSAVLDGVFSGISQADIGQLFSKPGASTSYEEFRSLVSRLRAAPA
jgi:hypothetical protein